VVGADVGRSECEIFWLENWRLFHDRERRIIRALQASIVGQSRIKNGDARLGVESSSLRYFEEYRVRDELHGNDKRVDIRS